VFIVERGQVNVEEELLLPLAMTKDIDTGVVEWKGKYLINPFCSVNVGSLVDFAKFPKAGDYFRKHKARLSARNVGKRNPTRWYRTIDGIHGSLTYTPKLLIPDIKAKNLVVYEEGNLYPHHNLYYVVSDMWDIRALQAILRSSIAKFFVWMYGVKMRGGYLRFQAQYLRKIGIPQLASLQETEIKELVSLAEIDDLRILDAAVAKIYGISRMELRLIKELSSPLQEAPSFSSLDKSSEKTPKVKQRIYR